MTHGVHHVALTVLDVAAAQRFFVDALGYEVRGEDPTYPAAFVSDGTTLVALHARIAQRADAEVEFAPEPLHGGPSRHMMLRIGGGLRIELIAAGS